MIRIATILVVSAALIVAGCGSDSSSDTESSAKKSDSAMKKDNAMAKDDKMAADDKMMKDDKMAKDNAMAKDDKMMKDDKMAAGSIGEQVKAPHFVSSNPAHGASVAPTAAKNIDLMFDFDLAEGTKATVMMNGKEVSMGDAQIVKDNLGLSVPAKLSAPGAYVVEYTACWPDGSCHEGSFGFNVKA